MTQQYEYRYLVSETELLQVHSPWTKEICESCSLFRNKPILKPLRPFFLVFRVPIFERYIDEQLLGFCEAERQDNIIIVSVAIVLGIRLALMCLRIGRALHARRPGVQACPHAAIIEMIYRGDLRILSDPDLLQATAINANAKCPQARRNIT